MNSNESIVCIVCQRTTNFGTYDSPSGATCFTTYGHYGSCVFDPMNGDRLEIAICDDCMISRSSSVLFHAYQSDNDSTSSTVATQWEPSERTKRWLQFQNQSFVLNSERDAYAFNTGILKLQAVSTDENTITVLVSQENSEDIVNMKVNDSIQLGEQKFMLTKVWSQETSVSDGAVFELDSLAKLSFDDF